MENLNITSLHGAARHSEARRLMRQPRGKEYAFSKKDLATIRRNRQSGLTATFSKPMNWKERTYAFFHGGKLYNPNGGASGKKRSLMARPPRRSSHKLGRTAHAMSKSQGHFLSRPRLLDDSFINKF